MRLYRHQLTIDMFNVEKLPVLAVQFNELQFSEKFGLLVVDLSPATPLAHAALLDNQSIDRNTDKPKSYNKH